MVWSQAECIQNASVGLSQTDGRELVAPKADREQRLITIFESVFYLASAMACCVLHAALMNWRRV